MKYLNKSFSVVVSNPRYDEIFKIAQLKECVVVRVTGPQAAESPSPMWFCKVHEQIWGEYLCHEGPPIHCPRHGVDQ